MLKGVRHCLQRSCRSNNASPVRECEIEDGIYERLDEESKRGPCWSELRRAGMTQWISCQPVTSDTFEQHEEQKTGVSSRIINNGYAIKQEEYNVTIVGESLVAHENRKRKRPVFGQDEDVKPARCGKQKQIGKHPDCKQTRNSLSSKSRWSAERYELAERSMLEILKSEGAVFGNPISRPALRVAARKRIGDTGLLDHLLKHIDGKVAPGGAERFRRWHNTHGVMEYWLESAGLVGIRRQAGVQDPYWIPPPLSLNGEATAHDPVHTEMELLRAEMAKMKNEMQDFSSRKQEPDQAKQIEELREELASWKTKIEEYQIGISNSLSGIQDVHRELLAWKTKTEQKLAEVSNTLSSMQSKQNIGFSPLASEKWEDWLESTNLDNVEEEDLTPWLGTTNLVNPGHEAAVKPQLKADEIPAQASVCAKELELLKEEMAKMKRDVQGLVPKKQDEDQANLTPDSSVMTNTKLDMDNPFLLFQEMCNELVKWKAGMEQQLMEIASGLQASKQVGHTFKLSGFKTWK